MSKGPLLSSQVALKIAQHIKGNNSDYYGTKEGLAELESIISQHFVAIAATGTQDSMPRRYCDVHQREEFKYESLKHELRARKTQCDKRGCEYVQVGKVFTVNLDCNCDCHQRPATDFTEQAQIIMFGADYDEVAIRNAIGNEYCDLLLKRIASALAEAATAERERITRIIENMRENGEPDKQKQRLMVSVVDVLAAIGDDNERGN